MTTMTQQPFDIFIEPDPEPVERVIPEADCEACGKHLVGWFDINTNHGAGNARWATGERTGHPECTAMNLTLNHVIYTLKQIAELDYKGEKCYQCPDFNYRGHPHTREHEVDYWLHRHYLPRVHDAWPEHSHADLDAYIANRASELQVGWALEVAA